MPQITEDNARQMIAVVNTRNVEKVMEQYAENATFQVPSLETPLKGKDAIRAFVTGNFAAFPDWTVDVTKVFVSGDETIVVNTVHGTHTGPLTGQDGKVVAPTQKKFVQDQATRVIFNDHGKVTSFRAFGNSVEMAHQLGLAK
jgi:steroid delta-isomerase-like uncharacterized protein